MAITAGQDTGAAIAVSITDATKPVTLEFTAANRVWIGVMVDNAYVYQGTIKQRMKRKARSCQKTATNATITLGAASIATIKANGEVVPVNPGENNRVQKCTLALQYKE